MSGFAQAQTIIDEYVQAAVAQAVESLVDDADIEREDAENLVAGVLFAGRMAGRAETLTLMDESEDFAEATTRLMGVIEAELVIAEAEASAE